MCGDDWNQHWPFPAHGDPVPDCPALPPCDWLSIGELAEGDRDVGGESG